MAKYNHMLDIAFEVISEDEHGSDITPEQIPCSDFKKTCITC
jgi:hypothetical protein